MMTRKAVKFGSRMIRVMQNWGCLGTSNTRKAYHRAIRVFTDALSVPVEEAKREHIEQHIIHLSRKYKATTVNLHLSAIKSFYSYLEDVADIPNPARKIKRLAPLPSKQRVLTEKEYQKIYATEGKERDVVVFLCNTGLRASEFCSLTPASFVGDFVHVVGKGRKFRQVPLNQNAKQLSDVNFSKSRITLYRYCKNLAANLNIEPFSPHSCRHYFATALHKKGVRLSVISKLLGHSCTMVTERVYIHWAFDDLVGVTDCLTKPHVVG